MNAEIPALFATEKSNKKNEQIKKFKFLFMDRVQCIFILLALFGSIIIHNIFKSNAKRQQRTRIRNENEKKKSFLFISMDI